MRANVVGSQRGEQTDHALRDKQACFSQRAMLAELTARKAVHATRYAFELSGRNEAGKDNRWQPTKDQVARPQKGVIRSEVEDDLFVGRGFRCHGNGLLRS